MGLKKNADVNEIRMFWRICQDLKIDDELIVADAIDEMEVLMMHTDSASLKANCAKMISITQERIAGAERRAQA